ncbi:hypothetical protein [Helicobacter suis]|uniref:hypothetical protein n=1 Tax=Helicobacter suis TaxID=104628 RepID=UPI0002D57CD9|nr:hypothetical protein [Helicobacter suis]
MLIHRKYFNIYRLFDENLISSMDYEHLLRSYHTFPLFGKRKYYGAVVLQAR